MCPKIWFDKTIENILGTKHPEKAPVLGPWSTSTAPWTEPLFTDPNPMFSAQRRRPPSLASLSANFFVVLQLHRSTFLYVPVPGQARSAGGPSPSRPRSRSDKTSSFTYPFIQRPFFLHLLLAVEESTRFNGKEGTRGSKFQPIERGHLHASGPFSSPFANNKTSLGSAPFVPLPSWK